MLLLKAALCDWALMWDVLVCWMLVLFSPFITSVAPAVFWVSFSLSSFRRPESKGNASNLHLVLLGDGCNIRACRTQTFETLQFLYINVVSNFWEMPIKVFIKAFFHHFWLHIIFLVFPVMLSCVLDLDNSTIDGYMRYLVSPYIKDIAI